jgi:hypothetical protein
MAVSKVEVFMMEVTKIEVGSWRSAKKVENISWRLFFDRNERFKTFKFWIVFYIVNFLWTQCKY